MVVEANDGDDEESGIGAVVDMGEEDDGMMCTKHPGGGGGGGGGICAVCLKEKLGHLVSSSLPIPSSFRSESSSSSSNPRFSHSLSTNNAHGLASSSSSDRKPRIPFLSSLQRSKSTAATSQRRRSFWSFLYYSKSSKHGGESFAANSSRATPSVKASSVRQGIIDEEEEGPRSSNAASNNNNKVSRSRSVGCGGGGSRSFSGDFFERLGDCSTIRRVESRRQSNVTAVHQHRQHKGINERVRCGGIFGGFNLTSSSSSIAEETQGTPTGTGRIMNGNAAGPMATTARGRSISWAWALASSPLRAFAKPSSTPTNKHSTMSSSTNNNNAGSNLPVIPSPSLMSVSG